MAHPNIKARREEVAHLLRYGVNFEPPVIAALSREFSCTATAIRRDIRVVKSDTDLRNRLATGGLARAKGTQKASRIG